MGGIVKLGDRGRMADGRCITSACQIDFCERSDTVIGLAMLTLSTRPLSSPVLHSQVVVTTEEEKNDEIMEGGGGMQDVRVLRVRGGGG